MPPEAKLGSTLIWYKASSPSNMEYWFKSVDTFLEGEHEHNTLVYSKLNMSCRTIFQIIRRHPI